MLPPDQWPLGELFQGMYSRFGATGEVECVELREVGEPTPEARPEDKRLEVIEAQIRGQQGELASRFHDQQAHREALEETRALIEERCAHYYERSKASRKSLAQRIGIGEVERDRFLGIFEEIKKEVAELREANGLLKARQILHDKRLSDVEEEVSL